MKEKIVSGSIVDVRTQEEFMDGHYPNAINIPLDQVLQRLEEFEKMETPIVTYCRSGSRSGIAVSLLKQNGINDVTNGGGLTKMLQDQK